MKPHFVVLTCSGPGSRSGVGAGIRLEVTNPASPPSGVTESAAVVRYPEAIGHSAQAGQAAPKALLAKHHSTLADVLT